LYFFFFFVLALLFNKAPAIQQGSKPVIKAVTARIKARIKARTGRPSTFSLCNALVELQITLARAQPPTSFPPSHIVLLQLIGRWIAAGPVALPLLLLLILINLEMFVSAGHNGKS
jgi:hypothetical protein